MDTRTEAGRAGPVFAVARHRARWWRAVVVAAAVAVLALVAVAAYVTRLQPLTEGSVSGLEGANLGDGDEGEGYRLTYRDRTLARGLLSVRNEGRWTVRVERVGAAAVIEGGEWHGLVDFRPDRNGLNPPNTSAYDAPAFRPFTLAPGEERYVSVAFWLDNCEHNGPGNTVTITHVPVDFRVFGMRRTQRIPLRHPWAVTAPARACPRSTAARGS